MDRIRKHLQEEIELGLAAKLNPDQDGIIFFDENEYIPLDDLGYNRGLGYFRKSRFPDITDEFNTIL